MSILVLAIVMILAGLGICYLSGSAKYSLLIQVVFIAGVILVIVGLFLLLTPVVIWIDRQLQSALGTHALLDLLLRRSTKVLI